MGPSAYEEKNNPVAGEEKKRAQAMDSQQTEVVSQQFERFKAAFAKKDYNSCSELKVLPTKFTSLPPLFESSPNVAQELTIASSVWSEVSPHPVIHASQRKKSEKTDNKKSLASTSKSCAKPEVVGCVVQTKKSGGFTLSKRVEAIQEELVTEKTLSQEVAKYMRLFHEFRILRLEQIDMEDPEDKKEKKEEVEYWQRDVVTTAKKVMTDAKKGRRPLVEFLHVVKEEIKYAEEQISWVKDEIETAKNKRDEDAREKEK